jgi:hypothetical protein
VNFVWVWFKVPDVGRDEVASGAEDHVH